MPALADAAAQGARQARRNSVLQFAARCGYAIDGLVHGMIGIIAITIAAGAHARADPSGALRQIAHTPGGVLLLWVTVLCLGALACWQVLHAFVASGPGPKVTWVRRTGELSKAVAYLAVGFTAFAFARGDSANSARSAKHFSGLLLSAPGGVFALVIIGLGIVAIGVGFVFLGVSRRFLKMITVPAGKAGRTAAALGCIGYIAKGLALCTAGALVCYAAVTSTPKKSTGLDGALKTLAALPFGDVLLVVVGGGLVAYGLYFAFRARLAIL